MLYTLSLHNVMSNIFQLKNLNIQSIVHHFYLNGVKNKRAIVKKIKRQVRNWKKTKTNFLVLQEAKERILRRKETPRL